jgi:hypothetical protein
LTRGRNFVIDLPYTIPPECLLSQMKGFSFHEEKRRGVMKRGVLILLALAVLTVFFLGCAGVTEDTKVKCPKCGAVFTVDEGLAEIQMRR